MFDFVVEVRDRTLARLGQIQKRDLSLQVSETFNNVGTWTLTLPETHPLAPALRTPGSGILITRVDTGQPLFSGPMVTPTVSASSNAPGGSVVFTGVSDTVILADRLAYPDPAFPANTQTQAFDVRSGVAESRMHAYINANIGPGAPVARRDSRLTMGTNGGRGSTPVATQARFDKLGELLSTIAAGEGLGFRVIQVGTKLEFQTYAVTDRTAEIRLDVRNNTLASHKVAIAPPGATRVVAGGDGTANDRTFVEVTSADSAAAEGSWGRVIEEFLNQRGTSDSTQLMQAGTDELAKVGQAEIAIQAVPSDATSMPFGTAWNLGDQVAVVVDGVELASVVTGYNLKADSAGVRIGAVLGDPNGFTANMSGQVTSLTGRVSALERTAEGLPTGGAVGDLPFSDGAGGAIWGKTMVGSLLVADATPATKQYRMRTSGAALDFEAGGQDMYLSAWSNANFTGTQGPALIIKRVGATIANGGITNGFPRMSGYRQQWVTFTTSTSYVNVGTAVTHAKLGAGTTLRITMTGTCFITAAPGLVWLGVSVGGTDYDVAPLYFNELSSHKTLSGIAYVPGVAAGTVTIQPRWKAPTGATLTTDSGDFCVIEIMEVNG